MNMNGGPYEDYVVVMPAKEAIQVANLLARYGMMFQGVSLLVEDDLFSIRPEENREAHKAMLVALNDNWLGHQPKKEGK